MIYYRIALQKKQATEWEWGSTVLTSIEAVSQLRHRYSTMPAEQMSVFMASSVEYLEILLVRANLGLPSNSWSIDQLIDNHKSGTIPSVSHFEADLGWVEGGEKVLEPASSQPLTEATEEGSQFQELAIAVSEPAVAASDYDEPYVFALPAFMPHVEALIQLMTRVRSGELEP